ncbi:unnamed protein product [Ixodes pacificus]
MERQPSAQNEPLITSPTPTRKENGCSGGTNLQNFLGGFVRRPVQWTVMLSPTLGLGPKPGCMTVLRTPGVI